MQWICACFLVRCSILCVCAMLLCDILFDVGISLDLMKISYILIWGTVLAPLLWSLELCTPGALLFMFKHFGAKVVVCNTISCTSRCGYLWCKRRIRYNHFLCAVLRFSYAKRIWLCSRDCHRNCSYNSLCPKFACILACSIVIRQKPITTARRTWAIAVSRWLY